MAPARVLVLMAAFNGSQWIVDQIDSILNQGTVDVSLVISDDCSSDDTRRKIDHYANSDRRVRTISPLQPTGSAAQNFLWMIRNTGADDHEYVALADQDDIWLPEKLVRASSQLIAAGADGYSSAVVAFWGTGREMILGQVDRPTQSDFLFEGAGQGCTFMMSASL